ncbi:MAG: hypothetical protein EBQ68_04980 [Betaproteobacteria bacterium]|nr:hypothetical protein [Betaproteobacteria bacterium]NBY33389.1 hypothetical protein [Betaproteobacteria bacterium]
MRSCIAVGLFLSATASFASNQQLRLHCQLFAGGEDHAFVFAPTTHPYTAKPIDLERFRFKAILSLGGDHIEHIKITVSYRSAGQALILQQATYLPPFTQSQSLTGRHQIYSPDLGRELSYECSVMDAP